MKSEENPTHRAAAVPRLLPADRHAGAGLGAQLAHPFCQQGLLRPHVPIYFPALRFVRPQLTLARSGYSAPALPTAESEAAFLRLLSPISIVRSLFPLSLCLALTGCRQVHYLRALAAIVKNNLTFTNFPCSLLNMHALAQPGGASAAPYMEARYLPFHDNLRRY